MSISQGFNSVAVASCFPGLGNNEMCLSNLKQGGWIQTVSDMKGRNMQIILALVAGTWEGGWRSAGSIYLLKNQLVSTCCIPGPVSECFVPVYSLDPYSSSVRCGN